MMLSGQEVKRYPVPPGRGRGIIGRVVATNLDDPQANRASQGTTPARPVRLRQSATTVGTEQGGNPGRKPKPFSYSQPQESVRCHR